MHTENLSSYSVLHGNCSIPSLSRERHIYVFLPQCVLYMFILASAVFVLYMLFALPMENMVRKPNCDVRFPPPFCTSAVTAGYSVIPILD